MVLATPGQVAEVALLAHWEMALLAVPRLAGRAVAVFSPFGAVEDVHAIDCHGQRGRDFAAARETQKESDLYAE